MEVNMYFLYAIIIIILIYVLIMILRFQNNMVEGMTDSSSLAKQIKDDSTKTLDGLLVSKYRSEYEDIILNMHEWCDTQILSNIVNGSINRTDPSDSIKKINELEQFKGTLNSTIKYIDSVN